jgi:hypothetical protein
MICSLRRIASTAAVSGLCFLIQGTSAWAHPGHGQTEPTSPAHYLVEPLHVAPVLLILLGAGATLVWMFRSSVQAQERRTPRQDS